MKIEIECGRNNQNFHLDVPVGAVLKIDGIPCKAVEDSEETYDDIVECARCILNDHPDCDGIYCSAYLRKHGKAIHFEKLQEQ